MRAASINMTRAQLRSLRSNIVLIRSTEQSGSKRCKHPHDRYPSSSCDELEDDKLSGKHRNLSGAVGSNPHGRLNDRAGRAPHFTPNSLCPPNPKRIADSILSANELASLDL